jgi:hypothetical protein
MVSGCVSHEARTEILFNFINIIEYNLDEIGQLA